MGRLATHALTLPDGRRVGYSLTNRPNGFRVRFVDAAGKRVERATGRSLKGEARKSAESVIRDAYAARSTTGGSWEPALAHLAAIPDLRQKSVKAYRLAVDAVRLIYPDLAGPTAVTPELATRFPAAWMAVPVRAGVPRSPVTVNSALTHLRALWRKHWRPAGFVTANPWLDVPRLNAPRGKRVRVPSEAAVSAFLAWLATRYPTWELPRLFVIVKMLAGCRTLDLCTALSANLGDTALTLTRGETKDRRDRVIELPADLMADLRRLAGPVWLWERAAVETGRFRRLPRDPHAAGFDPSAWRNTVQNLFTEFNVGKPPGERVRPHDLRARAMTTAARLLGSADAVARLIGCDPQTARHYIDAAAYDGGRAAVLAALRPGS